MVNYSVLIIKLDKKVIRSYPGITISNQLVRAGTSAALNYGEAMSASSRKDFTHKIRLVLKELRESHIALKILARADLCQDKAILDTTLVQTNSLISIFVKTLNTLENNKTKA